MLRNLSKIFPVVTVSAQKKGKNVWRPSHAEVAEAFVTLVPVSKLLHHNGKYIT